MNRKWLALAVSLGAAAFSPLTQGQRSVYSVDLYSAPRSAAGRTMSGAASLDFRYEFYVTRADDLLHADMTLAVQSATGGRPMSSPSVRIFGQRIRVVR